MTILIQIRINAIHANQFFVITSFNYLSLINQGASEKASMEGPISQILDQISIIPLVQTIDSPGFQFGWKCFWQLAQKNVQSNATYSAKWELANLLLNPNHQEAQTQLMDWMSKRGASSSEQISPSLDFGELQKIARKYLEELANGATKFTNQAKELLIKLQPKNEALSSLWEVWLEKQSEEALIRAAELGLTIAKLTLGLHLAQLNGKTESDGIKMINKIGKNHFLKIIQKK